MRVTPHSKESTAQALISGGLSPTNNYLFIKGIKLNGSLQHQHQGKVNIQFQIFQYPNFNLFNVLEKIHKLLTSIEIAQQR